MTPSQAARQPRANARRRPKDRYTVSSYRRAIERACERAFGMPDELRTISNSLTAEEKRRRRTMAAEWRRAYCWHPHQLRHTAATELRRAYGVEAAQNHSRARDPRRDRDLRRGGPATGSSDRAWKLGEALITGVLGESRFKDRVLPRSIPPPTRPILFIPQARPLDGGSPRRY